MQKQVDIELLEGASYHVYVTLKTADGTADTASFDVYGAAESGKERKEFTVEPTGEAGQYLVAIPALNFTTRSSWDYQICARRKSTGHEWLLVHGLARLTYRIADIQLDKTGTPQTTLESTLSPESLAVTVEKMAGIQGERGYSAYEVACQQGFEGTEAEWLEHMRQQTATLAVEQVQPLTVCAENAAASAEESAIQADKRATEAQELAVQACINATDAAQSAKDAAGEYEQAVTMAQSAAGSAAEAQEAAANSQESAAVAASCEQHATEQADAAEASAEVAAEKAQEAALSASEAFGYAAQAAAGAAGAQVDATAAAESATAAAESAAAIEGANDTIANYDAHWRAYYKTVTSLPTGYLQGAPITAFEYDMPKLTTAQGCLQACKNLKVYKGSLQALTNGRTFFTSCAALAVFESDLSALTSAYGMFYGTGLASFGVALGKLSDGTRMFVDCMKLQIFSSDLAALTTGSMMFYACQLNKESALRVLGSIPAFESGSHPLTIGIHIDNKTDEEVLAAIEGARAKGWTVTVQWNGKATTSTFALRPTPPPPVYVKREQDEQGDYEDASGTHYTVDWGHSVTSPHGTPEELGYTLFDTLEDALTEWGLTKCTELEQQQEEQQ